MRMSKHWRVGLASMVVLAITAAACGGKSPTSSGPTVKVLNKIGATEGALSLVAWSGYVEDGSTDPNYDWVNPFEKETNCQVTVKYADTSDEMVSLMRQGGGRVYDGVSASGDASNRLIAGGDLAAVDPKLFPEFKDVLQPLQAPKHNTVGGYHYGVPYMYGPNFLMYNPKVVKPAPTSWDVTWEANSPYKGKVTIYDSPIFIADAALYLKAHNPQLGITDPYELTSEQLDAATALLQQQKPLLNKPWALYTDEIDGFESGDMVVGTAWPINFSLIEADGKPVDAVEPSEGMTGWADTWMMSKNAPHPNCMLKWMEYTLRPAVQAIVAEYYGAATSNGAACALLKKSVGDAANTLRYGHCGDSNFLASLHLWKTPAADCGTGKTNCMDYSVWQQKWTEVRGG
jgi:putative spermidine/putrescine transport system substrate-binding protein